MQALIRIIENLEIIFSPLVWKTILNVTFQTLPKILIFLAPLGCEERAEIRGGFRFLFGKFIMLVQHTGAQGTEEILQ